MAILLQYAMGNPVFKEVVKTPKWECYSSLRKYFFETTNQLIRKIPGKMDRKYEPCIAGKTETGKMGDKLFS